MVKNGKEYLEILKILIENKKEEFSIRELSIKRKINYKSAYQAIKKLESERVINIKKKGNISLCSFNNKLNDSVYSVESLRKKYLLKNTNIALIEDLIKGIENPFYIILIFGSYAKGKQTKNSDIDVCVISDSEIITKKIEQNLYSLNLDIHLLDFSVTEFKSMLTTTKFNVGKEILNNNVILKGIENFYEIIKDIEKA